MNLKVYKSSAGSGKTSTLVIEYLSLALKNPFQFRQIIALTFTQKATNEMKNRLVNNLLKLKEMDSKNPDKEIEYIVNAIKTNTGFDNKKIKQQSGILLTNILHQYGDFGFNTIDSFVVKIVRSFAHSLKLAANFEIELDKNIIIEQAIEKLYESVGINNQLTQFLIDYTLEKMEEGKSTNFDMDLSKLAALIFDSKHYQSIDILKDIEIEDFAKVKSILQKQIKEYNIRIKEFGKEGLNLLNKLGLKEKDCLRGWLYSYFKKLHENHAYTLNIEKLETSTFIGFIEGDNDWYKKSLSTDLKSTIDNSKSDILRFINTVRTFYKDKLPTNIANILILKKISPLALIYELKQIIEVYSEDNDIIHISEINRKISDVVNEQQAPFIYEKIGQRYNHFLIDEFQDTSVIQWKNLIPLLENSLASSNLNLLVGDAKQAIYRWRDGEVEQFVNLPKLSGSNNSILTKERENQFISQYNPQYLTTNYRSKETIVNFNNELFTELLKHESEYINRIFEAHKQDTFKKINEGYVELMHFTKNDNAEKMLDTIYNDIEKLINNNYRYGDICILSRGNKQITTIADFLTDKGIKIVSSEALYLNKSRIINLIISFMKIAKGIDIGINEYSILHYFNLDEEYIIKSEYRLIEKLYSIGIEINIEEVSNKSAYEFTEYIIENTNIKATSNPFIFNFLDHIIEQNKKGKGSISQFLNFWEENSSKLVIDSNNNNDSVQLLTVHKAKGLEFPAVIFPVLGLEFGLNSKDFLWQDADESIKNIIPKVLVGAESNGLNSIFKDSFLEEVDRKILDDLNLLYVASTRPTDSLFLYFDEKEKISEEIWKKVNNINWGNDRTLISENNNIQIGTFSQKEEINPTNSEQLLINKYIYSDWTKKVQLKTETISDLHILAERGIQMHYLLSKLNTEISIDRTIDNAIKQNKISIEYKEEFLEILQSIIKDPNIASLFDLKYSFANEQDIILQNGKTIRPDKIIRKNNELIIIDFKLTDYSNITDSEKKNHIKQISNYMQAINLIEATKTKGILLYLHNNLQIVSIN